MKDKVVLITGASSGIGRACAVAFARRGASLILVARSKERLHGTLCLVKDLSPEVLQVQTDITDPVAVKNLFQKVQNDFGRLDILINNAGRNLIGSVESLDSDKLDSIFRLNFFAALWCIQGSLPLMKGQNNSCIVNISSIAGKRGFPFSGGYSASKFALNGLTESLRVELKKTNIHVMLVCPAGTDTSFYSNTERSSGRFHDLQTNSLMDPAYVAEKILAAVYGKKREIIVGRKGQLILFLNWLSSSLADHLLAKIFKTNS